MEGRLLQAGFSKDNIKRRLMFMWEIPWSSRRVESARGFTFFFTRSLYLMMGPEMIAWRSMLLLLRALFLPDAEDRCVMNLQGYGAIATKMATEDIRGGKRTFVR